VGFSPRLSDPPPTRVPPANNAKTLRRSRSAAREVARCVRGFGPADSAPAPGLRVLGSRAEASSAQRARRNRV